jgi:hypothetical protein
VAPAIRSGRVFSGVPKLQLAIAEKSRSRDTRRLFSVVCWSSSSAAQCGELGGQHARPVSIRPRGRGEAFVLLGFRIPGSVGLDDVGTTAVPGIVLRYKG